MKISVCICTCDRPTLLENLLSSLRDIELGDLAAEEVDLIIVDNNPTGAVRAVCRRVAAALPIELHFVEEPERGISFARNRAVAEALARGADFVAFIDDDDLPEPDWLRRLMEKQQETQAEIVGGVWRGVFASQTPDWIKTAPLFHEPVTDRLSSYGMPRGMGTFNVLLSSAVLKGFAAQGPVFAPELSFTGGGDRDLFIRAKKAGASFALAASSVINRGFLDQRLTARGVLTRAFRYGCSTTQMARRHRTSAQVRRRSLKALFKLLTGLIKLPLSVFSKVRLMRNLFHVSKEIGVLYRYAGRKFVYYR
jgi:glycosyltransferase involved in cell wall biosynthesis